MIFVIKAKGKVKLLYLPDIHPLYFYLWHCPPSPPLSLLCAISTLLLIVSANVLRCANYTTSESISLWHKFKLDSWNNTIIGHKSALRWVDAVLFDSITGYVLSRGTAAAAVAAGGVSVFANENEHQAINYHFPWPQTAHWKFNDVIYSVYLIVLVSGNESDSQAQQGVGGVSPCATNAASSLVLLACWFIRPLWASHRDHRQQWTFNLSHFRSCLIFIG